MMTSLMLFENVKIRNKQQQQKEIHTRTCLGSSALPNG